jgi:hypothetical protein
MRYQQDLQAALRKRYKRLKAANAWDITHEVGLVTNWISQQSALRAILTEAERAEPGLNFEQWEMGLHVPQSGLNWPSTEAGRASLAWQLMQRVARDTPPSNRTHRRAGSDVHLGIHACRRRQHP